MVLDMDHDVVIVGAGPAGSTAARYLSESGVDTLLIDKERFPRDKPCGGGLPTRVMKRYPYINQFVDSISYGSVTYSSSRRYKLVVLRDQPLLGMIKREIFDHGLVKIAIEKGTELIEDKQVVDIKKDKDSIVVVLDSGEEIISRIVIGCDGFNSIVANRSGLRTGSTGSCVCVYHEIPLDKEIIEQYFTDKRLTYIFIKVLGLAGYGWVFPKRHSINIGIGEFESAVTKDKLRCNLKQVYIQFVNLLKNERILPEEVSPEMCRGGVLPIFPSPKTYSDNILLCGDAAGFVNPITGEGIYYAMTSGYIAADVAKEAIKKGDASEFFLSKYQKRWMKEFGEDLIKLGKFNKQWGVDSERIVRLLCSDRKLAKLTIGVTGGQISFSRYKYILMLRYLYALMKDKIKKEA
ncbi:MAG: geranylgeranyl reductase family protein [Candidatus Thermoplasmatota archaeon]